MEMFVCNHFTHVGKRPLWNKGSNVFYELLNFMYFGFIPFFKSASKVMTKTICTEPKTEADEVSRSCQ